MIVISLSTQTERRVALQSSTKVAYWCTVPIADFPSLVMKFVLVLICVIYSSNAISEDDELDILWNEYKADFNKSYPDKDEDMERKKYFLENVRMVKQHNLEADNGLRSFRLKINHMSDMFPDELKLHTACYIMITAPKESTTIPGLNFTISKHLPKHVDWRKKNMVTPVKNQGSCESCWAFAAVGALESQLSRKTGELVSLSEQNLIDCATGAHGCHGGSITAAFDYIKTNKGIDTEESYPYTGKRGECKFSTENIGGTCKDYKVIQDSEKIVQQVVAHTGPVATGVNGDQHDFLHYDGEGIYHNDECDEEKLTHAVVIVGYGEKNGEKYWIIKNSWGPRWGMNGYMYIRRNAPFMCGIAKHAVYPIV